MILRGGSEVLATVELGGGGSGMAAGVVGVVGVGWRCMMWEFSPEQERGKGNC